MDNESVKGLVEEGVALIAYSKGITDGEERSSRFLGINALLATHQMDIEIGIAKLKTIEEAVYAQIYNAIESGTVSARENEVKLNPDYQTARINHANGKAELTWVKTHISIFENAHLMYRQFSRDA